MRVRSAAGGVAVALRSGAAAASSAAYPTGSQQGGKFDSTPINNMGVTVGNVGQAGGSGLFFKSNG